MKRCLMMALALTLGCANAEQVIRMRVLRGGAVPNVLVQTTDFTALGAFAIPGALDFGSGLAFRYVSGQFRLYGVTSAGSLIEYLPVADGSLSLTGTGISQASTLNNFGDIFQNEIYRDVSIGGGAATEPPKSGFADAGAPQGIYWDATDSRLYWMRTTSYNNTTTTSDTAVGYSTLNDGAHTGTGIGMWKLSPPKNLGGYGNRWVTGMLPIPAAFAAVSTGGRRLGVGFGGNFSIIGQGVPSIGPALFAMNPPSGSDPDHDYITTGLTQLLHYPSDVAHVARPAGLLAQQDFLDTFNGNTGVWGWSDAQIGGIAGVWIDGTVKKGVLFFTQLSGGNANTTISASPTPSHSVFTVANKGDVLVGDYVRWATDTTAGHSYAYDTGTIAAISGQQITVENIRDPNTDPSVENPASLPVVGGTFFAGGWYQGGGVATTRFYPAVYAYNPVDLALIAAGASSYGATPYLATTTWSLPGNTAPFVGGGPSGDRPGRVTGGCYDPATKRLYLMYRFLPNRGASYDLIYVYTCSSC